MSVARVVEDIGWKRFWRQELSEKKSDSPKIRALLGRYEEGRTVCCRACVSPSKDFKKKDRRRVWVWKTTSSILKVILGL